MGQCRDLFAQHFAVGIDVFGPDLQQVIERTRDHVALLDFRDLLDRLVKRIQCLLGCVVQLDLGKGDVPHVQHLVIDDRLEMRDIALVDQAFQPHLARGLRQAGALGQFRDGQAAFLRQDINHLPVVSVQWAIFHVFPRHFIQFLQAYKAKLTKLSEKKTK